MYYQYSIPHVAARDAIFLIARVEKNLKTCKISVIHLFFYWPDGSASKTTQFTVIVLMRYQLIINNYRKTDIIAHNSFSFCLCVTHTHAHTQTCCVSWGHTQGHPEM